eukprot:gene4456-7831_t
MFTNFRKTVCKEVLKSEFHTSSFLLKKPRNPERSSKNPQIIHNTFHIDRNISYGNSAFFVGTVVSTKMQKTAVLLVDRFSFHQKYKIVIRKTKKLFFHDEGEQCDVGDIVQVRNANRKLSKKKRFFFDKIVKKNPVLEYMKNDPESDQVQIGSEY